jgi:hypothetical protein
MHGGVLQGGGGPPPTTPDHRLISIDINILRWRCIARHKSI